MAEAAPEPVAEAPAVAFDILYYPGDVDTPLNLKSGDDRKYYGSGSKALPFPFDLKANKLIAFIEAIKQRAHEYGWMNLFKMFPTEYETLEEAPVAERRNLLTQYGECSLGMVRHNARKVFETPSRQCQDETMLYNCLAKSLTEEAAAHMALLQKDYTLVAAGKLLASGTCYLKVLIRESYLDTNATTRVIREQLSTLDELMSAKQSNITTFNNQVNTLVQGLHARGETSSDLLSQLFKGYKSASDSVFVDYIKRREERYDEGEDITHQALMLVAANKYRMMTECGEWNKLSGQEEKIIALNAQLTAMNKKYVGKTPAVVKPKDDSKKKGKGKKGGGPKGDSDQYAWKKVPPKEGDAKTKTVQKKVYHWCTNHQAWTVHSPAECKGVGFRGDNKSQSESKETKLVQALVALQGDHE
jgi:hypothetical protein